MINNACNNLANKHCYHKYFFTTNKARNTFKFHVFIYHFNTVYLAFDINILDDFLERVNGLEDLMNGYANHFLEIKKEKDDDHTILNPTVDGKRKDGWLCCQFQ